MNAALEDFQRLQYSTAKASLYESFLTARWLTAKHRYNPVPAITDADEAVSDLFDVVPDLENGRLSPFRYDWRVSLNSGRKTVWNNTTRGPKLATTIFNGDDLRHGLRPDAVAVLAGALQDDALPSRQALAALLLRGEDFNDTDDWPTAASRLLSHLGLSESELDQITESRPLGVPLVGPTEWSPETLPESLAPPTTVTVAAPPPTSGAAAEDVQVVIDARVERMLRRCVQQYSCVLLVGPPGTGKGALVRWLVSRAASDPAELGFGENLHPDPMWRTPDEGWSAFDLVGGLAPDEKGKLRWSNGLLPTALAEDRWLVLDETNRADLDKIMGPLLTWLSAQEVEIGRTTPHGGHPVLIGWTEELASTADEPDPDTGEPTRFRAGRDWRLLGTYNPQDAQRVFRMGQALSRRFVVVPVPALAPGQFEPLLGRLHPGMSDDVRSAVVGLYSAHHSETSTLLGPAVFLRMGQYLDGIEPDNAPELLAEAYVTNVGKFLSAFDDVTFERLGNRVVEDEQALPADQWEWIAAQRQILG